METTTAAAARHSKTMAVLCRALAAVLFVFIVAGGAPAAAAAGADRTAISEIEFKDAQIQDAVRIISELTGVNIVATQSAGKKLVTIFLRDLMVSDVVDSICRVSGLWYRYNDETGIYIVMTTQEYQQDIVVFRDEPVKMFQLKYLNVVLAARTISELFGNRVEYQSTNGQYMGNDYEVGDADAEFDDDDDDDDNDYYSSSRYSSSSSSSSRSSRYSSSSSRSNRSSTDSLDTGDMTTAQLALLEKKAQQTEVQSISEGLVGSVSQRDEATIYVTINRLHNRIFVRTSDEKAMEQIAQIIEDSDQQVPEVLLEMKVLEVQLTDDFESAFDISSISGSEQTNIDDGMVVNPLDGDAASVGSTLLGMGSGELIDSSTMVFQALSGNLRLRLQMLQENSSVSTLATPLLLAANNHPASLFIGEETVITTGFDVVESTATSTSGVVTTSYYAVPETSVEEIGNTLTILPSINADRSVVMRIVHENSTVLTDGGKIPLFMGDEVENVPIDTVNTSTLEGTVLAMDGMTIAVGGMMRTSSTDSESKVPLLGDIPLLGNLFKSKSKVEEKTELVLLITPHVISAPDQGQSVTRSRLGALSEYADELGYSLDTPAPAGDGPTGAAEDPAKTADALSAADGDRQKRFIDLTTVALRQVRMPEALREPEGDIRPAELNVSGETPVFSLTGIAAEPVAAWTDGAYFITALKVTNRSASERSVDVADLNGAWRAATLERQTLAPAGEAEDSTYLYLISNARFEQCVVSEGRQ